MVQKKKKESDIPMMISIRPTPDGFLKYLQNFQAVYKCVIPNQGTLAVGMFNIFNTILTQGLEEYHDVLMENMVQLYDKTTNFQEKEGMRKMIDHVNRGAEKEDDKLKSKEIPGHKKTE